MTYRIIVVSTKLLTNKILRRCDKMVTLQELKDKISSYSGNSNPTIWIKSDLEEDNGKAVLPSEVIIDDDGDVILTVSMEYLGDC